MNQDDLRLNGTNGFHDESLQASSQHLHETAAEVDELEIQRLTHKAFEVLCEGLESDDVSLRLERGRGHPRARPGRKVLPSGAAYRCARPDRRLSQNLRHRQITC